jgi:outer membrane protein TolC
MVMSNAIVLLLPIFLLTISSTAFPSGGLPLNSGDPKLLSLDSAIQLGLQNNPEIKSSVARIDAAKGRKLNSISLPPPEIGASFDDTPQKHSLAYSGEKLVGVSQTIEFPSNYFLRSAKNNRDIDISRQENAQVKLDITARIKTAYLKVLALQYQIKIAEENLEIADQFLKKAEIRQSVGDGTNLEKLTAKVQYTQALNSIETQKSRLAILMTELNYSMGNGSSLVQEYQLTDSLVFTKLDLVTDSLSERALQYNPSLNISKLRLNVSSVEKSLARSSLLPSFSIGTYLKKIAGENQNFYGVSFGLTIPLWFMMDQNGAIKEASSNYVAADADLHRDENNVLLQIKSALNECKDADRQVTSYINGILPQAEEVYRSASKSYESGDITYLEFLEAKQTVISSRSSYIDALLAYNLSIVTLEQATGITLK